MEKKKKLVQLQKTSISKPRRVRRGRMSQIPQSVTSAVMLSNYSLWQDKTSGIMVKDAFCMCSI